MSSAEARLASCAAAVARWPLPRLFITAGATMTASMPMIATTTISSIMVKPRLCRLMRFMSYLSLSRGLQAGIVQQFLDMRKAVAECLLGGAVARIAINDLRAQDHEQLAPRVVGVGVGEQAASHGDALQ